MIVLPQHLYERLVANGQAPDGTDHVPVVKFFDPAERDLFFAARYPLSVYAEAARRAERITESDTELAKAAQALGQEAFPDADPPTTT